MKTCRFCGKQQRAYMDQDRQGWFCRNERACFNRLLTKLANLRTGMRKVIANGALMADTALYLSKYSGYELTPDWCATLKAQALAFETTAKAEAAIGRIYG